MMRRSLRAFALGLVYDSPVIPRPGWSYRKFVHFCKSCAPLILWIALVFVFDLKEENRE